MEKNRLAFIDTFTTQNETYGKHNCPIQFCCEKFSSFDIVQDPKSFIFGEGENCKKFNIIPDEEITLAGEFTSGIKNEELKTSDYNGMGLLEGLNEISQTIDNLISEGYLIVGYNHVNYDLKNVNENGKRIDSNWKEISLSKENYLDVMEMAEYVLDDRKLGNYKMETVFYSLFRDYSKYSNLKLNRSTTTDIKITKMMFLKLLKLYGFKLNEKSDFSILLPEIEEKKKNVDYFKFGKYKGLEINKVFEMDKQYLNWVCSREEMKIKYPYIVEKITSKFMEME